MVENSCAACALDEQQLIGCLRQVCETLLTRFRQKGSTGKILLQLLDPIAGGLSFASSSLQSRLNRLPCTL